MRILQLGKSNTEPNYRHIPARLKTGSASMFNFFRRNTPTPAPAHVQPEVAVVPKVEGLHPLWQQDAVTRGTKPESTQTGTLRQLSRVIGRILADTKPNVEESDVAVKQAMHRVVALKNIDSLLYGAVDTITKSPQFNIATEFLNRYLRPSLDGLSTNDQLDVMVGLCRGAFNKMIDHQFSAPTIGRERVNGDQSMRTVFGFFGEVQQLELRLARGDLSAALQKELSQRSVSYQVAKQKFQVGQAIENDTVFQVSVYAGSTIEQHYKVTGTGFREAYFSALMHYAAVYSDRERVVPAKEQQPPTPKLLA